MNTIETKPTFLTPIEDLIAEDFGAKGTESRIAFDNACDAFIIGEKVKTERIKKGLTQEQLAQKIGTKKSYISRIENGHTEPDELTRCLICLEIEICKEVT